MEQPFRETRYHAFPARWRVIRERCLATFANSLSSFINLHAFNEWLNDVRVVASKSRHEKPPRALDYRRAFFAAIIGTLNAAAVAPFSNDHPRGAQRCYGALIAFAVPIMHSVAEGAQLTFDRSGSRTFRFR